MSVKCCICGKEIFDEIMGANNPDPLKDENGKFLSENGGVCCYHCNNKFVIPYRFCQIQHVDSQCELIQKEVIRLRSQWRK